MGGLYVQVEFATETYLEPRFTDPEEATRKLDGLEEAQYA